MARDKISIKFLIHLVGERPALWDKSSEMYKDRSLKETSWREICTFVNENYDRMQPDAKLEFTKMVTKKWTHIRDSWVKSMKYGYDEKTKLPPKPYVYHDELKFLQKILRCRRRRYDFVVPNFGRQQEGKQELTQQHSGDNNEDHELIGVVENTMDTVRNNEVSNELINHIEDDDGDDDDWPVEDTQTSVVEIKREINRTMVDQEIRQHPQQQQIQLKSPRSLAPSKSNIRRSNYCDEQNLNNNRHWNFFKGIFPSLTTLDDDHTLQFQAGVITLLQKLKASQKQLPRAFKKKRQNHDDEDSDYEWPVHKVNLAKRYSTRSTNHSNDPIADHVADDDQDSGSVNMEYF